MTHIKQTLLAITKEYKTSNLILAFVLFWTPVIVFAKLASEVIDTQPISLDVTILQWIHAQSTSFLDDLFLIITTIGNVEYILPITVAILVYLLYKKQKLNALIVFFGVGGAAAANLILKLIFHRDRPAFWQSAITETGYSFPSGHAMLSSALLLCLIVLLWNTKWRSAAIIGGGVLIALIGLSRLYLGVHYPTDIVAGWSVSLVWIIIVTIIAKRVSNSRHSMAV